MLRFVTYAEEDRISNLPENMLDSILERLPFQDVVKTSILSKKWRYTWTRMRVIVADKQFSKKFAKNGAFGQHGFIRIINRVLLLHDGPILKFDLHIPNMFLDSFQEVDQWMLLLSRKGVRELVVDNLNQRYQLPSYVFSCLELRKLKLVNCIFKPPFKRQEFLNLKDLSLENIDFGVNLSETFIDLPQLKKLTLHACTNVHNFNIKATKLQDLMVSSCPDAMLLRLLHSQSLHSLVIIYKSVENLVRVERMNLTRMLSNMPNIQLFGIHGHLVKSFIAEKIPKWLPHAVNSLTHLGLQEFELRDLNHLECALCLLRNSPNLKTLIMTHVQLEPQIINNDVRAALNHFEAVDCLGQTLNQLQTVYITYLQGSKPELLFIKLLLAHSPSLEKLEIQPSKTCDAIKKLDIAMDVTRFPRASPKAEVIFVNSVL